MRCGLKPVIMKLVVNGQLHMDGRTAGNIRGHRHMPLMLLGDDVIAEGEVIASIKIFGAGVIAEKWLEQTDLLLIVQANAIVLNFYP